MYFYESGKYAFRSTPDGLPNPGECFVDHSLQNRGGHLGHAMVEYAPDSILCFYPNCDDGNCFAEYGDTDFIGHSGRGWTEFKRSIDGGITWSEGKPLDFSKRLFEAGGLVSSFCEKAILAGDGAIVLFHLMCNVSDDPIWEPYLYPQTQRSTDGGETWEKPIQLCAKSARIWDVCKDPKDDTIYVLLSEGSGTNFCNYATNGYFLYASKDNGKSFYEVSRLPFECSKKTFYGTMIWLQDGKLLVYGYSETCERYLRYVTTDDGGKSWSEEKLSRFEKQIRNPQCVRFKDTYFLFGRAGIFGTEEEKGHNVMYLSADGIHWDEGRFLSVDEVGFTTAYYSNAIVTGNFTGPDTERLLYQYSKAYKRSLTNVMHRWIDADLVKHKLADEDVNREQEVAAHV